MKKRMLVAVALTALFASAADYDVIVDLRPWSPTYRKWMGFHLTGENMTSLLVPEYFGHGYLVLEDSIVSYKCGEVFSQKGDSGIMYDDQDIGIEWPKLQGAYPGSASAEGYSVDGIPLKLSDKDQKWQGIENMFGDH